MQRSSVPVTLASHHGRAHPAEHGAWRVAYGVAWQTFRWCLPLVVLVLLTGEASAAGRSALASELEAAQCELADLTAAGQGSCSVPGELGVEPQAQEEAEPEPAADLAVPPGGAASEANEANEAAAPMCDRTAASIAAPAEVPEVDRGRIEQARCDAERWLALLASGARAAAECQIAAGYPAQHLPPPALEARAGRPEAAPPSRPCWPARATPALLPAERRRGVSFQPGHPSPVYRPPTA